MPIVNDAKLDALRTAIRSEYNAGLQNEVDQAAQISTSFYEPSKSITHAWLENFPKLKAWVSGTIPLASMKEYSYVTTAARYGVGLEVSLTDLELDTIGHYPIIAQNRGAEVVRHKNRIVFEHLKKGESENCYDGKKFFATDHPVAPNEDGTGTAITDAKYASNHMGGSGTPWYLLSVKRPIAPIVHHSAIAPELKEGRDDEDHAIRNDSILFSIKTVDGAAFGFWQTAVISKQALTADSFSAAFDRMSGFIANGNTPLGIMPDTLLVPSSLRATAKQLIDAQFLSNGSSNIHYKSVDLIVSPWL